MTTLQIRGRKPFVCFVVRYFVAKAVRQPETV
ncbi:hypothetical protein J2785_000874 [Burkholderia ambifaria]|nr:hypothetical protein [Burkholderia ambifaria]